MLLNQAGEWWSEGADTGAGDRRVSHVALPCPLIHTSQSIEWIELGD